jgi:diguanylate cyclase (GGDEF)-like protein/PAS domain S-box-containing protein
VAVILEVDREMTQILGWYADDVVGKTSLEFIHPDDQELAVENWMQMLGSPGPGRTLRLRHKHRDGHWVWLEMTNHNLLDDPSNNCVVAEMLDISDQMPANETPLEPLLDSDLSLSQQPLRIHEALRAREQLLHRLAEAIPLGVLHVDSRGRILYTNHRLHTILGAARAPTFEQQFSNVIREDKERVAEALDAVLRSGLDNDIEMRLATSEDHGIKEVRQCNMNLRSLTSENGEVTGAVVCLTDVTESVRMREELQVRATFDKVTRCHNRASTMESLEMMLAAAGDKRRPAVIFVDLDRFKEVNDHLGHAAGDELLRVVAERLLRAVRSDDLVGRIGGDEFLVVCPGVTTVEQAIRAARRVADALRDEVRLKTAEVSCRASIGVAWSVDPQGDADTLVAQADAAMYEAKRRGTGKPVLYAASQADGDWPEPNVDS